MAILKFQPDILQDEIDEALKISKGFKYPKKKLFELFVGRMSWFFKMFLVCAIIMIVGILLAASAKELGKSIYMFLAILVVIGAPLWFLWSLFRAFRSSAGQSAKSSTKSFYSELFINLFTNYTRAFLVLSPSTIDKFSLSEFSKTWKSTLEQIKSRITELIQEKTQCSVCGKEGIGILTKEKWQIKDSIMRSEDFLHCCKCKSIYCPSCFINLKKSRVCPNCETPLKGEALKIFINKPDIVVSFNLSSIDAMENEQERVANIVCKMTTSSTYNTPWTTTDDKPKYVSSKGNLECWFHNKAVKIGTKWYLIKGQPGVGVTE